MKYIKPITPGEILLEEFMEPYNITKAELSKSIGVAPNRIGQICKGTRKISPDTAFRLAKFFETSVEFWTNLQMNYEIEVQRQNASYNEIKSFSEVYEERLFILKNTLTYKDSHKENISERIFNPSICPTECILKNAKY